MLLDQVEEHFRLVVDGVEDYAIFLLDTQGYIRSWNTGAQRVKGYTADEIVGQHFSRFYRAEDRRGGKLEMELAQAAREGPLPRGRLARAQGRLALLGERPHQRGT